MSFYFYFYSENKKNGFLKFEHSIETKEFHNQRQSYIIANLMDPETFFFAIALLHLPFPFNRRIQIRKFKFYCKEAIAF